MPASAKPRNPGPRLCGNQGSRVAEAVVKEADPGILTHCRPEETVKENIQVPKKSSVIQLLVR